MQNKTWARVAALIITIAVSMPSTAAYAATTKEKLNTAREEAVNIEQDVKSKNESSDRLKDKNEASSNTLDGLSSELDKIAEKIAGLEEEIVTKQADIDKAKAELEPLEEELAREEEKLAEAEEKQNKQYKAMKKRIQYMYEYGNTSLVDIMAESSSYEDFINKKDYIKKLGEYDRKASEEYKKNADNIRSKKEKIEKKRDEVLKKKEDLEADKEKLDKALTEQTEEQANISSLVDIYKTSIATTKEELAKAEAEADRLQKELDKKNSDIKNLEEQLKKEEEMTRAAAAGAWTKASAYQGTESDRYLLANIIYCEAGNQPYVGQVAVGAVIMNRVRSSVCPDTISGVVYQKNQFEPVCTGRLAIALARNDATESCYKAADAAMAGENPIGNCLFFRTPIDGINYKYKIGGHIFY